MFKATADATREDAASKAVGGKSISRSELDQKLIPLLVEERAQQGQKTLIFCNFFGQPASRPAGRTAGEESRFKMVEG